jgi:hypothetical protein
VGFGVEYGFNEDVEDKMFGKGMKYRSLPSGKGEGGMGLR